jgi:ribosomal protein S18 acetylase RimI-like enzyme
MIESDIPDALDLWQRTPGVGLNEADSPGRLAAYLVRNPEQSFVARDSASGKMLGAILGGNDGRRGYLQHLAVDQEARGGGIGTELVRRCLDAFAELDIHKSTVFVFDTNDGGQAFWSKLGYQSRPNLITMQRVTRREQ